jgi:hypothetical protein
MPDDASPGNKGDHGVDAKLERARFGREQKWKLTELGLMKDGTTWATNVYSTKGLGLSTLSSVGGEKHDAVR